MTKPSDDTGHKLSLALGMNEKATFAMMPSRPFMSYFLRSQFTHLWVSAYNGHSLF